MLATFETVFNSNVKPDPGAGLRTCSISHFSTEKGWAKFNLKTHSYMLPFDQGRWNKLFQSQSLQGHLAQLIAQCWQQGVLTEIMFIIWMGGGAGKRKQRKCCMMRHSTWHSQTLPQGNVLCSFVRSHTQKQNPRALSMASLHTSPWKVISWVLQFLLWLCNSPV